MDAMSRLRLGGRTHGAGIWQGRGPFQEPSQAAPPPPPLFTVSGTSVSRARSAAGHVFSFSPDSDSRRRGAASGRAHLLCGQLCPEERARPQRRGQSWLWPLHVASGTQHSAQDTPGTSPAHGGCQLAVGHVGHPAIASSSIGTASAGLALALLTRGQQLHSTCLGPRAIPGCP